MRVAETLGRRSQVHQRGIKAHVLDGLLGRRGDAAPAFAGENYDGQQVTLASATGPKGLVLWFYPKAGTGG